MAEALLETGLKGFPVRRGKVRDVYDLGNSRLLIVATDRISAFDCVMPNGIPDKGRVLTALSHFWFGKMGVRNHLIPRTPMIRCLRPPASTRRITNRFAVARCLFASLRSSPSNASSGVISRGAAGRNIAHRERSVANACRRASSNPRESIRRSSRRPRRPSRGTMRTSPSREWPTAARRTSEAKRPGPPRASSRNAYAERRVPTPRPRPDPGRHQVRDRLGSLKEPAIGPSGFVDEALTPDSSRYWPALDLSDRAGRNHIVRQAVRARLARSDVVGQVELAAAGLAGGEVVEKTRAKYVEAFETLTGRPFPWK